MEARLQLRPHQEACVEHAMQKNTIVCLPTGEGKTLIAVRLIEYALKTHPDKLVVFLVPTQALVDQQARYLTKYCLLTPLDNSDCPPRPPDVLEMIGDEQAGWELREWQEATDKYDVFLGTPAVFQKALIANNFVSIDLFSLVVFDECHYATGNSAMASIMRDAIHPYMKVSGGGPRILGLTASFVSGGIGNLQKDRRALEELLNSTIIAPDVATKLQNKNFIRVTYGVDGHHSQQHVDLIESHLEETLQKLPRTKDIKKAVKQCSVVFSELGRDSLLFYVEHAIVQQIVDKIATLESLQDDNASKAAKSLRWALPSLREGVQNLSGKLHGAFEEASCITFVPRTPKIECLMDQLQTNFSQHPSDSGYRGIVFVEQIALVSTLARQINDAFCENDWTCGVVAGTGAQTKSDRKVNLDGFRNGTIRILVATAACEEGLDVSECQFVIMFSQNKTAKSQIQRTGRARHPNAELYYFENDPNLERSKAAKMSAVASDGSLALSPEKLKSASDAICIGIEKHPYPYNSFSLTGVGVINVYNCKDILVRFCSQVLSQSVNPSEELYKYTVTQGHQQKVLGSVKYPTPSGWKKLESKEMEEFWEGQDMQKVFLQERTKRKSNADKLEMRFVYVVTVKLREEGLLDGNNMPSKAALSKTKSQCPLRSFPPDGIALNKRTILAAATTQKSTSLNTNKISLARSPAVFREYLSLVFDGKLGAFEDHLFEHSLTHEGKPVPYQLWYPTPRGWEVKSFDDFKAMFGMIDLDDQLPDKPMSLLEKWQTAFAYMVVNDLHDLGCLNEDYEPNLHQGSLQATRNKCTWQQLSNLRSNKAPEVPSVIDLSEASPPSEMSTASDIGSVVAMSIAATNRSDVGSKRFDPASVAASASYLQQMGGGGEAATGPNNSDAPTKSIVGQKPGSSGFGSYLNNPSSSAPAASSSPRDSDSIQSRQPMDVENHGIFDDPDSMCCSMNA